MKTLIVTAIIIVSNSATSLLLAQPQSKRPTPPNPAATPRTVTIDANLFQIPKAPDKSFANLAAAHAAYTKDFTEKPGFGSSRMWFLPMQDFAIVDGKTYHFNSPDLLGLENVPVAYQRAGGIQNLSVAVMSKKELRTRLTRRPLTIVESNAVVQLRAGKDLVTSPERVTYVFEGREAGRVNGIHAVGALRAQANCAQCHGVKEGTLLGAFSYTLVPTNALAVKLPDASRPPRLQTPRPAAPIPVSATNLSITMSREFEGVSKGSLTGVSVR